MCEYAIFYELESAAAKDNFPNLPETIRVPEQTRNESGRILFEADCNVIAINPTPSPSD